MIAIVPQPVFVEAGEGVFTLTASTRIVSVPALIEVARFLKGILATASGFEIPLVIQETPAATASSITFTLSAQSDQAGPESYWLEVRPESILIGAEAPAGAFYAIQSLRQLLPVEIETGSSVTGKSWEIPAVRISDGPRFPWRGLHLDVGRHFFPVPVVKRFIDLMALHKFNTLHWHLTEDQGWRVEIKKYPRLAEIGSQRAASPIPAARDTLDNTPYGGFYSQEQMREVVDYAARQFITIVPEIEMPGHACAALAAYPELGCTGGPYQVRTFWGIEDDVFCAGNEQVYAFLENVLNEVIAIFPGNYFHIGGDECPKVRWQDCPKCQAKMQVENLANAAELQSYFIRRIEKYLNAKGRILVGWDEILEGGLAPGATVMSWRGVEGGIQAASAGHDVVMTPTEYCYLDYYASQDIENEPPAIGGFLPLEKCYQFEPVASELSSEASRHVLGGQGNLWTEYIPTPELLEYMTYPRASALAEVFWSSKEQRDWLDFRRRLAKLLTRLEQMNVHYRPEAEL